MCLAEAGERKEGGPQGSERRLSVGRDRQRREGRQQPREGRHGAGGGLLLRQEEDGAPRDCLRRTDPRKEERTEPVGKEGGERARLGIPGQKEA